MEMPRPWGASSSVAQPGVREALEGREGEGARGREGEKEKKRGALLFNLI